MENNITGIYKILWEYVDIKLIFVIDQFEIYKECGRANYFIRYGETNSDASWIYVSDKSLIIKDEGSKFIELYPHIINILTTHG